jgi:hypothetical protein
MSSSPTVVPDTSSLDQARRLLWPVAVVVFLFTASYPANDYITASKPSDIGLGGFLVVTGIAAVSGTLVFGLLLPWAFRRGSSGGLALILAILGTLFAPGFWTGFPPALAAGGALLGWARADETKGRKLSRVAFVVGMIGVVFNVVSYVDVFV